MPALRVSSFGGKRGDPDCTGLRTLADFSSRPGDSQLDLLLVDGRQDVREFGAKPDLIDCVDRFVTNEPSQGNAVELEVPLKGRIGVAFRFIQPRFGVAVDLNGVTVIGSEHELHDDHV